MLGLFVPNVIRKFCGLILALSYCYFLLKILNDQKTTRNVCNSCLTAKLDFIVEI